jgi:hypothetical protein
LFGAAQIIDLYTQPYVHKHCSKVSKCRLSRPRPKGLVGIWEMLPKGLVRIWEMLICEPGDHKYPLYVCASQTDWIKKDLFWYSVTWNTEMSFTMAFYFLYI